MHLAAELRLRVLHHLIRHGFGRVGIGQMRGALGQRGNVEPVGRSNRLADPGAVVPVVTVGGILHRVQPGCLHHDRQLAPPPAEQGPQQRQARFRDQAARAHPSQTGHPTTATQPHQQRLGLIVRVMRGHDR